MVNSLGMPDDALLFDLATRVGRRLHNAGRRMVTAESCTAGWIAKAMTDVVDSSQWFDCGYVTYSNAAKMRDLGVSQQTLDAHGAVSEQTVREMARGALRVSGADVAVAVSGIAGPDGRCAWQTRWHRVVRCRTPPQRRGPHRRSPPALRARPRSRTPPLSRICAGTRVAARAAAEGVTSRRLFFALWPDDAMQAALAEATRSLLSSCDGTPVPPRNFHFTLAFLGAVPESRIAALTPIAARVALAFTSVAAGGSADELSGSASPLTITLDHIDYWRKSQILCATPTAEPTAAIALAETLKRVLTEQGFAPDLKPFRAHATLARKVGRVTHERSMPSVRWSFGDFRLVESRTAPTGSIYSGREIYPLDIRAR